MNLCTSTNILCERADGSRITTEESMLLCAAAGYREMDFCFVDQIFGGTAFLGDRWREFVGKHAALADRLGIVFSQSHGGIYNFCAGEDPWQEELMRRCVEGSAMLGVPWMVVHPATLVTDGAVDMGAMERNVSYFRRLCAYAGRFGVGIAIENMWGRTPEGAARFAIRAEELRELIDSIGAENVGACWDTGHGSMEGLDQAAAIRLLGKRLKATHISDQTGANNIHILPYTGFTAWDDVLKALADIGYRGAFTYEMQHYLLYMPLELVTEALALSRSVGAYMIRRLESFRQKQGGGIHD